MNRRLIPVLFLIVGLASVMRAADMPAPVPVDPKVRAVLDPAVKYYAAHQTFEADLNSTTKMDATGMKQEFDSTFHLALSRPNSVALTLQSGMMGGSIISDGKKLLMTMPMAHAYSLNDAPKQFSDIFAPVTTALAMGGLPLGLELLFKADGLSSFEPPLTKSEDLGDEPIDGKPAHHVRLTSAAQTTDLWIAEGDVPLLVQVNMAPNLSGAFSHLSAEQKAKMPVNLDSMKMSRLTTYSNWKFDQPIAASVFNVQPPAGYKTMESLMPKETQNPLAGKSAPDFTLKDLDGASVSLKALRGKVVVLDFWATWCGPCGMSLPLVSDATAAFKDKGVVFYTVNEQEDAAAIKKFQTDKSLAFPVLLDTDGKVGALYKADAIPETVLIDQNGKIAAVHIGYDPGVKEKLTRQLTDMLAGKDISAAPTPAPAPTAPSTPAPTNVSR